jgi:predicted N-formylglutamate amidohydrolase
VPDDSNPASAGSLAAANDEYVEIAGATSGKTILFTCEHASARLPPPWRFSAEDAWLETTHWAYDLGAAELARELATSLHSIAVLSRFSRLLADPNRPEDSPDLCRATAEGRPVHLNSNIDARERAQRLVPWRAYHDAAHRAVERSDATVLLAVHTFTPVYEGVARDVEVGILFDRETELADALFAEAARAGFRTAMNEPYSGKAGLMYSIDRHAARHGRRAIEIELRQDLAVQATARARLVMAVGRFIATLETPR